MNIHSVKFRLKTYYQRTSSIFKNRFSSRRRVYVISHERSGTHFLINTINNNLKVNVGFGFGSPSCDYGHNYIGDWLGPYKDEQNRFKEIYYFNRFSWEIAAYSNTLIKSHCSFDLYEKKFKKAPVIYIYRDPRDTMVVLSLFV